MASGIKSAIRILVGNDDAVTAVDCYVDDTDFTPLLQGFIDDVGPDDEGIIFTDLLGGSVCNKVMTLMTASFVKFNCIVSIALPQGDPVMIQTYLDTIFKGLVPLLYTLGCLKLLKKNTNVNWLIIGTMVIGLVLGLTGIC